MKNENYVFFYVRSPDPADMAAITTALALEPSEIRYMAGHSWQLVSALPATKHVNDHIEAFIELLQPRAEVLQPFTDRLKAGIHCQLTRYHEPEQGGYRDVGLNLWQPTIKLLAALNLSLTFDYFFL